MKVQAKLPNLRVAPRKVRLVTRALVGVDAREAVIQLRKQTKKSAGPLETLLKSAIANAINNFGLAEDNLYIAEVRVGDGLTLQRWLPRAFGRATPLLRRGSNVTIILEEKIEGKDRTAPKERVAKVVEKTEASDEVKAEDKAKGAPVAPEKATTKAQTKGASVKKMFQRKSV